jgi:hypothetical protein
MVAVLLGVEVGGVPVIVGVLVLFKNVGEAAYATLPPNPITIPPQPNRKRATINHFKLVRKRYIWTLHVDL